MRCAAGADSWADHPRASSLQKGGQNENIDTCGVGNGVRNRFGSRAGNVIALTMPDKLLVTPDEGH
jgi:hypothetical protein